MICEAVYNSFDEIPDTFKSEFESVNGKWQLKETAIPGVGPLFNAALDANAKKAVEQVKRRNQRIKDLEAELDSANTKLELVDIPGATVLNPDDAKLFEEYTKLGSVKDLQEKLEKFADLENQSKEFTLKESIKTISEKTGLNYDVLIDWALLAKDVEFTSKEVQENGKQIIKPLVKLSSKNDKGEISVTEIDLLEHAKKELPDWKFTALTETSKVTEKPGVKIPVLHSSTTDQANNNEPESTAEKFNKRRAAAAPNPFQSSVTKN